jgi:molybdopterin converting factor small subunit
MIDVTVEFLGVLAKLTKSHRVDFQFKDSVTVSDIIAQLIDTFSPEFKQTFLDPELNDPRPNVLILLNNKEINVLDGLKSPVKDGDKLVLLPVSHGG